MAEATESSRTAAVIGSGLVDLQQPLDYKALESRQFYTKQGTNQVGVLMSTMMTVIPSMLGQRW